MINTSPKTLVCIVLLVFTFLCVSCVNTRKAQQAIYFNNIQDTTIQFSGVDLEPVIQKNDILSISVSSPNPEATVIFNTPNILATSSGATSPTMSQSNGYLVNQDGYIQFPSIGNIKAEGLSKKQLKDSITQKLLEQKLLVDPIVSVRYLNFRVTVLGEVAHPTVVSVPSEKITLFEAIGLAGDLTIFAKRNNVLLIREENGSKTIKRLNLNSGSIFTSPYYYLKSNDIVYAEPNKARIASVSETRVWLPSVLSALSFIAIILTRVVKL